MAQYLVDRIEQTPAIRIACRTEVAEVHGDQQLEGLTLRNCDTGEVTRVPASTMFVFIGATPPTEWLGPGVLRDDGGFILTGADLLQDGRRPTGWPLDRDPLLLETRVPGLFAAGDVRHGSGKRVAAAVG